eukprot:g8850.t1
MRVTLFEKEASAGGHTLTESSGPVPVDLGFQVYNLTTYPHLVGFLDTLGVETEPSDMSFALSMDGGKLEWGSHSIQSLFAQWRNLIDVRFWWMIFEVIHFNKNAIEVVDPKRGTEFSEMTLDQYLLLRNYSDYFKKYYLLPMCAAIWSVPLSTVLEFPIQVLVQFWMNHHLLDIFQRPVWRVIRNRSIQYVNRVLSELPDTRLGTEVQSVNPAESCKVQITTPSGSEYFDTVILATHADISLKLMEGYLDEEERSVLAAVPFQENDVFLHTDATWMPNNKSVWASWNFVGNEKDNDSSSVCVTYWLNRLQNLESSIPELFVTLNPPNEPQAETVIRKLRFSHPIFNFSGIEAQKKLKEIQGRQNVYYCGAWCSYGFHEDGIRSAINVAELLNCTIPWIPRTVNPKWSLMDSFWLQLFTTFAKKGIQQGYLKFILPNGTELEFGNRDSTPINTEEWRMSPALKATVRVLDMKLFKKVVFRSDTGLGEAYMDEDFVVDDLGAFMCILVINAKYLSDNQRTLGVWNYIGEWILSQANKARPNTINGSKENIKKHYDLGNGIYKLFLDPSMTYSCGIHRPNGSLLNAQMTKLDKVIEILDIQETDHVLEIGCGWGSFSIRAAQMTGCRVTGLTLSAEQLKEGKDRIKSAGLESLVNLEYCDYRQWNPDKVYEKIVSIEMIEGVGHEHLDDYFKTISAKLKPGGKLFLQAITTPNHRYQSYCKSSDFIREYIFPGGHLPSLEVILSYATRHGLLMESTEDIGLHYAVTLREWRQRWMEKKEELELIGCDHRFHKMFEMYFAYCEGAFEARYIHDFQMVFTKTHSEQTNISSQSVMPLAAPNIQTGVLMMVYFSLAGVLVSRRPYMWLMPISSLFFVLLFALCSKFSSRISVLRKGSTQEKAIWATYCIQCIYSILIGLIATLHSINYYFSPMEPKNSPRGVLFYCSPLCTTLGFYGFQVWNVVYHRLYITNQWILGFYTLMLILLGYLTYRVEHVEWVTLLLLSNFHDFLVLVDELGQQLELLNKAQVLLVVRSLQKVAFLIVKWLVPICVLVDSFMKFVLYSWTASYCVFLCFTSVWIITNCSSATHHSFTLNFIPSLKQD